jgi:hypothetical protein
MQQDISNMPPAMGAQQVLGAPIQVDGTTLVPALAVRGNAGARMRARPVGVHAVRDGTVSWRPAVDLSIGSLPAPKSSGLWWR